MALNPFRYPQAQHVRTQDPPAYSDYTRYKPILKTEFSERCVYCRVSSRLRSDDSFGVDHYKPKSLFPSLATTYSNLYFACNTCNRRKSDYWPTRGELKKGRYYPNPCDHVMTAHLRTRDARVEVRSEAGRLAEEHLMLNDAETVRYREQILVLVRDASGKRASAADTKALLIRKLARTPSLSAAERADIEDAIERSEDDIREATESLRYLGALD